MISSDYKRILNELHLINKFPGINLWYEDIKNFIINEELPESILDFGCSKGTLITQLKEDFPNISTIEGYDPGVEEYERIPTKAYDMLISTDVFEHIEPEFLDLNLKFINSLWTKTAWIIIANYPAKKTLSDGRNAHLIIEDSEWWLEKINQHMPGSSIYSLTTIIKNPDADIKAKRSEEILIPKGKQIEYRLVLKKN